MEERMEMWGEVNQERRNQILEMITRQGTINNGELMERFDISIETVRRDLSYLENQGYIQRVYGGAILRTSPGSEPEYANRAQLNYEEKNAIARTAASLVSEGDTLFLDTGTTALAVTQFLKSNLNITIITNSLRAAIAAAEIQGCESVILGGQVRVRELAVSGFPAEDNMAQFNIDKAFIGVAGVIENGITDFHIGEASLRRKVIENAGQVIVLADTSKFGVRAKTNICPLKDVDIVITDSHLPQKTVRYYEQMGLRVMIGE